MDTIVIYSAHSSNRLEYVANWLLKEQMHLNYRITSDEAEVSNLPFFISYGKQFSNGVSIPDGGLLFQQGITRQEPQTGLWNDVPVLFPTDEEGFSLSFDLFSSVFYLLSRYEEYYPYPADQHGRYPASASIIYRKGWLQRPIVDECLAKFRKLLLAADPGISLPAPHFSYQPTYDVDMAYSHLHKGFTRIFGAYMRALLKGDVRQISERTQVLKYKQKDPYDSFRWLRQLHKEYDCKPLYFVLAAERTTKYDKNIHPQHPAMMRVIRNLVRDGALGIHPSYYSDQGDALDREKKLLEQVGGDRTWVSRQHYIRVKTPDTYYALLKHGIKDDYTMGYGSHLGFRAGTGNSFLWYDLQHETTTALRIHPFCFMDTTAHFEAKLSVADSFTKLEAMSKLLEKTGSTLITIFHNFSLGTASEWKGWRQAYEHFLMEKSKL